MIFIDGYKNNHNNVESKTSPYIFSKNKNTKYKLVPFKIIENNVGKTKYLPPVSKQWKNTVYNFNYQNNIDSSVNDLKINSLIKGYFSMYFNHKFLEHKYISRKKKRRSFNKIYVSKAEIKHTNDKAIITIYVFNKEKLILLKKLKKLKAGFLFDLIYILMNKKQYIKSRSIPFSLFNFDKSKINPSLLLPLGKGKNLRSLLAAFPQMGLDYNKVTIRNIFLYLRNLSVNDIIRKKDIKFYFRLKRFIKKIQKIYGFFRRLRLRLSLNKLKFEHLFLLKLIQYLSKYYGKKVELNIVNLKSLANNSDIFTQVLTLKVKKEKSNAMDKINALLSRVHLPEVNRIKERGRIEKLVDYELIDNKYRNVNISSILLNKSSLYKDELNTLLDSIYYKTIIESSDNKIESLSQTRPAQTAPNFLDNSPLGDKKNEGLFSARLQDKSSKHSNTSVSSTLSLNKAYFLKLRNIIFDNIKYKNMGGAKLRVKGRLTRRYRADRAVFKYKWKGGLKNIDSAFKGLSSVVFRGYLDSNVEISRSKDKRRIGSFGVRTWISGK